MKTKLLLLCALALYAIALGACAAPPPTATPVPPPDPASLIKSLSDALNAGNVDAVMAFFADDATQTQTPPPSGTSGVRTGKEQIRGFFQGMIADKFSGELSNLKVTGDKITYTSTFSTDTYRKLGVAPLVVVEEAVFERGKIKSQTITVTPESLAKIQAAMAAAQAKSAPTPTPSKTGSNQVLLIAYEKSSRNMELALTKEVGVMTSMLERAGFEVVVASVSGQPITGGAATLKPDLKLADVKVEDYAGFILPCMGGDVTLPEAVEIVRKAVTLGKPVAAQLGSVIFTLAKAGVLSGKQFAILSGYEKYIPDGIYKGAGVVQDGNLITSGVCPNMAREGLPDTTAELTQKFIALLTSAR